MPDLSTSLHVDMLEAVNERASSLPKRLLRAIRNELFGPKIYGMQWGDPETVEPLRFIRRRYVTPYVAPSLNALEIGPGGGRWTRYLLEFERLYVVDYYEELLTELKKNVKAKNVTFVRNNGTDFPEVPDSSIDYLFSFGCFVHLDVDLIESYLMNMKRVLKPGANAVVQYSDKTKIMAELNEGFSDNTPAQMREMVCGAGYEILEEDLTTLWHSSVIRFCK